LDRRETPRKLHLGCGLVTPPGWVNVDASWNARLAKYPGARKVLVWLGILPRHLAESPWSRNILVHDVRKGLPFPDEYFLSIYASHLLEHLYLAEAKFLLKECFRCLQPGGVLRIVVPGLQSIVAEYLEGKAFGNVNRNLEALMPADRMMTRLNMRAPEPPGGNLVYRLYTALKDLHSHKWMYDADSLIARFKEAGFTDIRRCAFLESRIDGIEEVEQPDRVLNGAGICVEGIRPD
jgi:predicted SAM-dependent methyltransferase